MDKFLQLARLIKQRSKAKFMCDNGHVLVNGEKRKASYEVKVEDEVEIRDLVRIRKYRVLQIPSSKNVSKASARELTELLEEKKTDWL